MPDQNCLIIEDWSVTKDYTLNILFIVACITTVCSLILGIGAIFDDEFNWSWMYVFVIFGGILNFMSLMAGLNKQFKEDVEWRHQTDRVHVRLALIGLVIVWLFSDFFIVSLLLVPTMALMMHAANN